MVVEHDMRVAGDSDWVMDIRPGAGDEGGHVVAFGTPAEVAGSTLSRTAPYLSRFRARPTAVAPASNRLAAPQKNRGIGPKRGVGRPERSNITSST